MLKMIFSFVPFLSGLVIALIAGGSVSFAVAAGIGAWVAWMLFQGQNATGIIMKLVVVGIAYLIGVSMFSSDKPGQGGMSMESAVVMGMVAIAAVVIWRLFSKRG